MSALFDEDKDKKTLAAIVCQKNLYEQKLEMHL
jgi:hypothetical protein